MSDLSWILSAPAEVTQAATGAATFVTNIDQWGLRALCVALGSGLLLAGLVMLGLTLGRVPAGRVARTVGLGMLV